jgi:predicted ArsR family transcriptional regulator
MRFVQPRKDGSHLAIDIIESLTRNPGRSTDDLAKELGFSPSTVRARLNEMLADGYVSYATKTSSTGAKSKLWVICDEPMAAQPEKAGGMLTVHQITTKTYPVLGIRGEFETYFFGPAPKEAA